MFLEQRTAGRHPGGLPPRRLGRVRPAHRRRAPRLGGRGARVLHLTGITPALSEASAGRGAVGGRASAAAAGALRLPRRQPPRHGCGPGRRPAPRLPRWPHTPAWSSPRTTSSTSCLPATARTPRPQALLRRGVQQVVVKRGAAGAPPGPPRAGSTPPPSRSPSWTRSVPGTPSRAGYLSGVLDARRREPPRAGVTGGRFAVSTRGREGPRQGELPPGRTPGGTLR